MLLSTIASVFSALLITQGTLAALTPQQIANAIDDLAALIGQTNTALSVLSTSTSPSDVASIGDTLVNNIQTLINDFNNDATAIKGTPPIPDAQAQPIIDSLDKSVTAQQALQSNIIDKHLIFAQFSFTARIETILKNLETAGNSAGAVLISVVPSRKNAILADGKKLDQSLENSIKVYNQKCTPSSSYPNTLPTCTTA